MIFDTQPAKDAVLRTLRDYLPAHLAALDATRYARFVCPPGPYTIPASGTLTVRAQGGTAQTFALTSGSRTAAQVAQDLLAASGFAASVVGTRLVLTSTVAPTEGAPSSLAFESSSTAAAALGIAPGDDDVTRLALSAPATRFRDHSLRIQGMAVLGPTIGIEGDSLAPDGTPRTDLSRVPLRIEAVLPAPVGARGEMYEAIRAYAGAVCEVLEDGDGQGRYHVGDDVATEGTVIQAVPRRVQPSPSLMVYGAGAPAVVVASAFLDIDVTLFDP